MSAITGTAATPAADTGSNSGGEVPARRLTAEAAALQRKFPPRIPVGMPRAAMTARDAVVRDIMGRPYAGEENYQSRHYRRLGVTRMLDWLESQPGASWQERWDAGCGTSAGSADWRDAADRWLKDSGRIAPDNTRVRSSLGTALGLLAGCDVIRLGMDWLLASATPVHLAADMARIRDPDGFAALEKAAATGTASVSTVRRSMLQVALIMAVKGGLVSDITVGDCLELLEARARVLGSRDHGGTFFYQLMHAAGYFPAGAPAVVRMLDPRVRGQRTAAELIDRYDLACGPVRDLLVDYLNERRPGIDYVTMMGLAYQLGLLFWKDLETTIPGSTHSTWPRTSRWRGSRGCSTARRKPLRPTEPGSRNRYPACPSSITSRSCGASTSTSRNGRPTTRPGGRSGQSPARSGPANSPTGRHSGTANHGQTSGPANDFPSSRG